MPIYEYECKKCHHRFERMQKFSDPHVTKCPKCKGPIEQIISAPAVQFKGEGWYVTDYNKKSSASSSDGERQEKTEEKPDKDISKAKKQTRPK
jgi:putative FmdB family regulatory protein